MINSKAQGIMLGSATLLALGAVAHTAEAANTGVPIQAIILDPVQITQTRSLNFGSLTESGAGGTMSVDNLDAPGVTGGVTSVAGTIQAGGFTLKGSTGVQINVTAPASVILTSGGDTMTVGSFTVDGAAGTINATAFTRSLAAATETGFRLGGTLTVGAAQAAGTYAGTVTVTASYN
jgi:hypothetical protein